MSARLLGEGEPLAVECDAEGRPLGFRWVDQTQEVTRICNRWRVRGEWWRGEKGGWEYIKLVTATGLLCLIARDLDAGVWFLIRIYD